MTGEIYGTTVPEIPAGRMKFSLVACLCGLEAELYFSGEEHVQEQSGG